jgi:transposase
VKPNCSFQQVFQSTYLFGAFSPITGDHFELELPYCNTDCFELFLQQISNINPTEFKIILLDNGAFHKAKRLKIPNNIALLFIPPYSPELNPAEKIWWKIKRAFTGKLHKTLANISAFITNETQKLTNENVKKICAFEYILKCNIWTNSF